MLTQQQIENEAASLYKYSNYAYEQQAAFEEGAEWANEQNAAEIAELVEALRESALQIKYLQYKFQETGSGNAVLANILALLKKYE